MRLIQRYLVVQILAGLVVSTAVLLPLFAFLDLVEQLDDVGTGTYAAGDAFAYVALLLPRRFIQLAPFIALIGNVVALGRLAANSEIISMRAAGLSPGQISFAAIRVGILLVCMLAVFEQFVAPPLEHRAVARRSAALEHSAELGEGLGIWTRNEQQILHIGRMQDEYTGIDVEIMALNDTGVLERYVFARQANILSKQRWYLRHVTSKTFDGLHVATRFTEGENWQSFLNSDQLATLRLPVASLSPADLYRQISYLRQTGQQSDAYVLALWRKLGVAVTTVAMIMLSVPFVFGTVRTGFSAKLVLATVTGIGVYLFDQIVSNTGLLLDLNAAFVALTPGLTIIMIAWYWMERRS